MSAPRGNKFWKLRSKHGRDTLFATPDMLWEAACEYFTWCDKNPWKKQEAIKSGDNAGTLISVPTQRPYTMSGLCIYLDCNQAYFRQFKERCGEDFSTVITRIEEIIETQQFEGAAVGAFNANIIARKLGLADKKELEGSMEIHNKFDSMTESELDEYLRSNGVDPERLNSEGDQ
jgi:hypothetical protein